MALFVNGSETENMYVGGEKMERVFANGTLVYEATIYVAKPTVSGSLTYNGSAQKPTITGYDSAAMTVSGTQSATNVGTYTIKFTLNKGYAWKDGTTDALSFTWSIAKKSVTKPTLSGSYTYNGKNQAVTINNYDSAAMTISGTQSATNAGTYTIKFTLNKGYAWADGTTDVLSFTWSIGRKAVTKPTLSGSFTYSGSAQTVTVNNYNSTAMTISGTQSATKVGDYHVYFTLNSNYKWADGTTTKLDLTWRIKAAVTYPDAITLSGSFTIPSPYNRVQFFAVGGGGGSGNGVDGGQGEGGGGGGYTALSAVIATSPNTVYTVHIGKGGSYADGEATFVSLGTNKLVSAAGGKMGGTVNYTYEVRDEWSDSDGEVYVDYDEVVATFGVGGAGGSGGGAGGGITSNTSKGNGGNGGTNGGNGGAGVATVSGDLGWDQYGDDTAHAYPTNGGAGQGKSTTYNGVVYSGGGGGGCNSYNSSTYYSPATTGLGGESGGGRGARTRNRVSGGKIYSQPTSGTPGTGGGCGGIVKSSNRYVTYNASSFAVTGGSGAVVAKLWEV